MITDINQLDFNKEYTYADYLTWKFRERVELIKGKIFKISPAPNRKHQEISNFLERKIILQLDRNSCKMYHAPFDVLLTKHGENTVVQPDICVICDPTKLTEQGCTGAPNLIIEILSPGNSSKEMKEKFEIYEENEVLEYWIVSPMTHSVIVYTLNKDRKYIGSKPFVEEEIIQSKVLTDLKIVAEDIFAE